MTSGTNEGLTAVVELNVAVLPAGALEICHRYVSGLPLSDELPLASKVTAGPGTNVVTELPALAVILFKQVTETPVTAAVTFPEPPLTLHV